LRTGFGGEPEGRNDLKDREADGRIILKLIFEKWDVVNAVMNLRVP
jgi:hypothetical protein